VVGPFALEITAGDLAFAAAKARCFRLGNLPLWASVGLQSETIKPCLALSFRWILLWLCTLEP
jgi:hypothetical protein